MSAKYRLSTLGCKVNQYESQQVRELLESLGMVPARAGEHADLAVVNTCAVTCSATAKSRQSLRKLAAGATETVAIGCYASADPDAIGRVAGVGTVAGHDDDPLERIRTLVASRLAATRQGQAEPATNSYLQVGLRLATTDPGAPPASEPPPDQGLPTTSYSINLPLAEVNRDTVLATPIREFGGHQRAFLKIQDGCDAHCTYCIIPSLRKNLRSKPVDAGVAEAERLVASGHREIVLTGIFLGAYGRPTALRRRFTGTRNPLAELTDAVARVPGLRRLRLSSLEPGDVDDALLAVLARHENCVPHLHLPLQAGSDEILRRMNRQYDLAAFDDMIARVHAVLDRPAISTDIIVGFPGETDACFAETLATARRSGFCKIHAFPFSPRPGTAAARWQKDYVHHQKIKDRMQALARLGGELSERFERQFAGETTRVIVEADRGRGRRAVDGLRHGRSDRYFEVYFDAPQAQPGAVLDVRLTRRSPQRMHGELVAPPAG
jgi:threonylcarbamoyladenosine tRNA methylthiotransferase MtaB